MRIYDALEDPPVLLERLEKGSVTQAEVDAVREVYPDIYDEMQVAVMEQLTDMRAKGRQLPYQKRIHIGTVMNIETDPSLNPELLALVQSNSAPTQGPPAGPGSSSSGSSPGGAPNLAAAFQTNTEKLEAES